MFILNKNRDTILAKDPLIANTLYSRAKGLLGKRDFRNPEAMVIKSCNAIHTFFMNFAIDILFVDKNNKIVGVEPNIKPWRLSHVYWLSRFVIELPVGTIEETKTSKGDELVFSD